MKKMKIFAFTAILALVVSGCSNSGSEKTASEGASGKEEVYEWKLGWNSGLENDSKGAAAKAFKEYVEKESDGRITIEFFPNETYATSPEMIEAVQVGALEMAIPGANELANVVPEYAALSLPFLTEGFEEAHAILDGPIGDELEAKADAQGFKSLNDVELGFTQITNNVRPIEKPEDLEGIKMRSPNDVSLIETFKALGSSVSTMAYTEIYNGLSQGVIDGQFNPLMNIFDQNMHEVQDYLAMTNHTYYYCYMILNKDVFDSLDEDLQKIVLEASEKAKVASRELIQQNEEEYVEKAKSEFKEITYPDLVPFQEAVKPVYKEVEEVMGAEIINDMQTFLEEKRSGN
ncbi:TRAP transporter substrate-binding protein [Bacillus weihaiensis]|uniref:TRAP transporter substrate-binding protein n=1 Tax=Bacillus weihaiensis TaxID=1547283 RepID=UPI002356903B|nr:TRAP transporter substrate-binding protein [Bacillus weihaiensis]